MKKNMKKYLREAIDATIEAHRDGATPDEQAAAMARLEESFHAFVCAKAKSILGESSDEDITLSDDESDDEDDDSVTVSDDDEDDDQCDDDADEDDTDEDDDDAVVTVRTTKALA